MTWQAKYVVFSKPIDEPWPENDPLIKFHRKEYDDGIVEMVWWRDGDYLHWLRIPRKVRAEKRYYFSREPDGWVNGKRTGRAPKSDTPYLTRVGGGKRD